MGAAENSVENYSILFKVIQQRFIFSIFHVFTQHLICAVSFLGAWDTSVNKMDNFVS